MQVRADAALCDHVSARGGVLWVRSARQRCCGGWTTALRATTSAPRDAAGYTPVECDAPIDIRFLRAAGAPGELTVELGGIGRKRPIALWDGCKFKL